MDVNVSEPVHGFIKRMPQGVTCASVGEEELGLRDVGVLKWRGQLPVNQASSQGISRRVKQRDQKQLWKEMGSALFERLVLLLWPTHQFPRDAPDRTEANHGLKRVF